MARSGVSGSQQDVWVAVVPWAQEDMTRFLDRGRHLFRTRHSPGSLYPPMSLADPAAAKGFLVAGLLLVLLTLAACARIGDPEGGSAGTVAGDVLYIGTTEGQVVALYIGPGGDSFEPGERIWEFELQGDESNRAIYGAPVVADGTVYVGGYDGILYALSVERSSSDDPKLRETLGGPIVGGPVVVDGLVLVGSSDGNLYAFDIPEQGDGGRLTFNERWFFPTDGKVWSTPAVAEGTVYFGSLDHNVYAVSLVDGQKVWTFETGGAVVAEPLVIASRVYVGSFDSVFYAIDAQTGDEVWRFEGANSWYWGRAVATAGTVYAPSLDGNLYALDIDSGRQRWSLQTDGPIVGSPAIVFDMVAVPSADGEIRMVELGGDGSVLYRCNVEEKIRTPLVEQGGFIYFGVRGGDPSIRALRIQANGKPEEEWAHLTESGEVTGWICTGPKLP